MLTWTWCPALLESECRWNRDRGLVRQREKEGDIVGE